MKLSLNLLLSLSSASALACTCGAGRDSASASGLIAGHSSGLLTGIQYDYAHGERLNVDTGEVANPFGNFIHTHRTTLTLGYAANDSVNFVITPQYVVRTYRRTPVNMMGMQAAPTQSGSDSGFGDTLLAVRLKQTRMTGDTRLTGGLLLGVETPTGDSDWLAAP